MSNLSDSLPDALKTIRLHPLLTMRPAARPLIVVGATPLTTRRIGVVFGGAFEGSRLADGPVYNLFEGATVTVGCGDMPWPRSTSDCCTYLTPFRYSLCAAAFGP
jgi:hypothetical protein